MSNVVTSPYANMRAAITNVLSAKGAIKAEIENHAARHQAKFDAMRKEADSLARINEGIARQNG